MKGSASALYGPYALGRVINLVSRRPGPEPEADIVLTTTSNNGQDVSGYASASLGGAWSGSVTGGSDRQSRQDFNGDGWADRAGSRRWAVRPRLFWKGAAGGKVEIRATTGIGSGKERG